MVIEQMTTRNLSQEEKEEIIDRLVLSVGADLNDSQGGRYQTLSFNTL